MRIVVISLFVLLSQIARAASPYEGSWFTCIFEMGGRVKPWSIETISIEKGELTVFSEWGTKYTFVGSARVVGKNLVVRGCSYYVDQPMESCDPDKPPVTRTMRLPLSKSWPSNLDAALKKGESIYLSKSRQFGTLASRCESLIEADEAKKVTR